MPQVEIFTPTGVVSGTTARTAIGSDAAGAPGRFGPVVYADWRTSSLGAITETLEQRLILKLAGEIRGRAVLDVGCGDGALALMFYQRAAARDGGGSKVTGVPGGVQRVVKVTGADD